MSCSRAANSSHSRSRSRHARGRTAVWSKRASASRATCCGVGRVVVAPLSQLDRAAAPHVRNRVDALDPPLVASHVVEDQPFAQRQVAEREFLSAKPPEDRVQQHGARDHQVGAARVETGQQQPLLDAPAASTSSARVEAAWR